MGDAEAPLSALASSRKVHVRITLAETEIASPDRTLAPVLVNVPFYATTDMLSKAAYEHFKEYLPPFMGSNKELPDPWAAAWFEDSAGVITGRQVPLGVLSQHHQHLQQRRRNCETMPWHLTVHFRTRYPDEACPFDSKRARSAAYLLFNARHMYFNSLKEALYILNGGAGQVMKLDEDKWERLWGFARDGCIAEHAQCLDSWTVNALPCRRNEDAAFLVPLRVLTSTGKEPMLSFASRPARAVHPRGSLATLREVLLEAMPAIFAPDVEVHLHTCSPRSGGEPSTCPIAVTFSCHESDIEPTSASQPMAGRCASAHEPSPAEAREASCASMPERAQAPEGSHLGDRSQLADAESGVLEGAHSEAAEADPADPAADQLAESQHSPKVTMPLADDQHGDSRGHQQAKNDTAVAASRAPSLRRGVMVHVCGAATRDAERGPNLLDAPVFSLYESLRAPDLFLYVVVNVP